MPGTNKHIIRWNPYMNLQGGRMRSGHLSKVTKLISHYTKLVRPFMKLDCHLGYFQKPLTTCAKQSRGSSPHSFFHSNFQLNFNCRKDQSFSIMYYNSHDYQIPTPQLLFQVHGISRNWYSRGI